MTDQVEGRLWCLEIKMGLEFFFPWEGQEFFGCEKLKSWTEARAP